MGSEAIAATTRLVFFYGPPGVGKVTVAWELDARTGMKQFHIHATVDPVAGVVPFGSASFGRLVRLFRRELFAEAARAGIDVIFTNAYSRPDDDDRVRELIAPVLTNGGTMHFVQVTCSRDDLLSRVEHESRRNFGKLTSPAAVAALLERHSLLSPLPIVESFRVNTTAPSLADAAFALMAYFGLPTIP